ncbi:MAG: IPT/TIG domain-containing protein, partial [Gemmatimonadota bacterium]
TGRARTGWTVGTEVGEDTASAAVEGALGSPVTFTATAHNLSVASADADPLVLGQTVGISGTGFDPIPANNVVTINGEPLTVTAASPTQLEVTVPMLCLPEGTYDLLVSIGSITSAPLWVNVTPASFLDIAVGEQLIIPNPDDFCVQFDQATGSEEYLIGVQSTAEDVTSLTPVSVAGIVSSTGIVASRVKMPGETHPAGHVVATGLLHDASATRLRRHREVEASIRSFNRDNYEMLRSNRPAFAPITRSSAAIGPDVAVDDTLAIRVIRSDALICSEYDEITTVVRAMGDKSIWLEDVDNPAGGYQQSDFDSFVDRFDNVIYAADVAQFGPPTDDDGNGRIVMVITKEVNRRGSLGFTSSCDYAPRSAGNEGSNEGEVFYGETPDPNGIFGFAFDVEGALLFAPSIQAHELVHVIQIGQRFAAGGSFPAIWIGEGQASMGEEIVGFADEGRAPGQNLGFEAALNEDDPASTDWFSILFTDLAFYFGWDPISNGDVNGRTAGAPHECSFLDVGVDNPGPCVGGRDVYGTPWSLLRWLSDQYGSTYPGGEPGLQQDIISNDSHTGFELLEVLLGVPMDSLLAQWAAMLYVDDRLGGANPALTLTSWNLFDIFDGLITALHLQPDRVEFTNFANAASVRGGSSYYTIISGANRAATALEVAGDQGQTLPAAMQVWVVRLR